jgi:hypothetical protein
MRSENSVLHRGLDNLGHDSGMVQAALCFGMHGLCVRVSSCAFSGEVVLPVQVRCGRVSDSVTHPSAALSLDFCALLRLSMCVCDTYSIKIDCVGKGTLRSVAWVQMYDSFGCLLLLTLSPTMVWAASTC